jgi:hypothetical protein
LIQSENAALTSIARRIPESGIRELLVCGVNSQPDVFDSDMLYAWLTETGSFFGGSILGSDSEDCSGNQIEVIGTGAASQAYIYGSFSPALIGQDYFSLFGVPGGSMVEIKNFGENLFSGALTASAGQPLLALERSLGSGDASVILARFDAGLALQSSLELGAIPDGSFWNPSLSSWANGAAVHGLQRDELPVPSSVDLSVDASALTWSPTTVPSGSPPLSAADTLLAPVALDGWGVNNVYAFPQNDTLVYVGPLE